MCHHVPVRLTTVTITVTITVPVTHQLVGSEADDLHEAVGGRLVPPSPRVRAAAVAAKRGKESQRRVSGAVTAIGGGG